MAKDIINDKAAMHRLISNAVGRVLGEAPIAPPAPPPQAPAPAAAPPSPPPGDGVNQVSMTKAAGDGGSGDLQKGQITIEMVVEKLNSIRSGRSFKDENILGQMGTYFQALNDNEKLALYAFLKGISQIVTGDIQAQQAATQQTVQQELNEPEPGGMKTVKHIKPQIVKAAPQQVPQQSQTPRAPSPIVPRQR